MQLWQVKITTFIIFWWPKTCGHPNVIIIFVVTSSSILIGVFLLHFGTVIQMPHRKRTASQLLEKTTNQLYTPKPATVALSRNMCHGQKSRFFGDKLIPPSIGILIMGPYKPLRNWVDEFIPYYRPWHTWYTMFSNCTNLFFPPASLLGDAFSWWHHWNGGSFGGAKSQYKLAMERTILDISWHLQWPPVIEISLWSEEY